MFRRFSVPTWTSLLFEWWCECGEFQALHLPCTHVMVVWSSFHLQPSTYIDPVHSLQNIFKAYVVQFQLVQSEDYWSTYIGPNLIPIPTCDKTNQEDQLQLVSTMKWTSHCQINQRNVLFVGVLVITEATVQIDSEISFYGTLVTLILIYVIQEMFYFMYFLLRKLSLFFVFISIFFSYNLYKKILTFLFNLIIL